MTDPAFFTDYQLVCLMRGFFRYDSAAGIPPGFILLPTKRRRKRLILTEDSVALEPTEITILKTQLPGHPEETMEVRIASGEACGSLVENDQQTRILSQKRYLGYPVAQIGSLQVTSRKKYTLRAVRQPNGLFSVTDQKRSGEQHVLKAVQGRPGVRQERPDRFYFVDGSFMKTS